MKSEFLIAITQLAAEKNLPRDVVLRAVEAALVSAYKKDSGLQGNITVRIDPDKGSVHVYQLKTVVEEVSDPKTEMTLAEARRIKPDAQLGDTIALEVTPQGAGRIAAQTAKQVVLQRLREAEREKVYEEFAAREGEVVSGVIQRVEPRQVIVDLGHTEAVLPASEQVRTEQYRPGQRLKFYLLEVQRTAKGPQLILSRTHRNLVKRLLELEVPEVARGIVEVKAVAREPGQRSKVAVAARQPGVDPVGACVGLRGLRIQNIVNELGGERIDVVEWDRDPARFVANALSPAQVSRVIINEEEKTAIVVVPDRHLSLAIGKEGQNARLAAKLTGWRIDIKPESVLERVAAPSRDGAPAEAPPRREEPSAEERRLQPWEEVIEREAPAAEEAEAPAPAEVQEEPQVTEAAPQAEPSPVGAQPQRPVIRFAEEVLGRSSRRLEKEDTKGKKAKKGIRRPKAEDEEFDLEELEEL
ncbi:MAG: transcription termination factor NusA [Dehalococcoidia bacterium]|jgi:N utilization substance protein A|nr:transcription termination factor NusA [Dehalococcoidia bacterium]MDW8009908.1 transcription termination factor NusA [Chloroflexota bacterium]